MGKVQEVREKLKKYVAPNYAPLPFVPYWANGEWIRAFVESADGTDKQVRILDLHSNYSASNLGHNHPDIVTLKIRRFANSRPALISRAAGMFEEVADFSEKISQLCGIEMGLPKNSGVEGFEVAVKICRRWGYEVKGIKEDKAEIIVAINNFHGRT